jgi:hypothetical protein
MINPDIRFALGVIGGPARRGCNGGRRARPVSADRRCAGVQPGYSPAGAACPVTAPVPRRRAGR